MVQKKNSFMKVSSCGEIVKKRIEILLLMLCLLGFSGCASNHEDLTPTGYPSGEVQRPQIMYNGAIYFYTADGFDQPLPHGYEQRGEVKEVDNRQEPAEDWCGSRVEVGQKIYVSNDTAKIYVEYETGYAEFAVVPESTSIR